MSDTERPSHCFSIFEVSTQAWPLDLTGILAGTLRRIREGLVESEKWGSTKGGGPETKLNFRLKWSVLTNSDRYF